jgi:hypothetical protein
MAVRRVLCRVWGGGGNVMGRNYLEVLGVDGRIILRSIFRKWDVRAWTGSIWLRIGTVGGYL